MGRGQGRVRPPLNHEKEELWGSSQGTARILRPFPDPTVRSPEISEKHGSRAKLSFITLTHARTCSHMLTHSQRSHTHTLSHTLAHAHTRSHTLTHSHTLTRSHTLTHAHTLSHMLAHVHTLTHAHTCSHMLTHAHTRSQMRTHFYFLTCSTKQSIFSSASCEASQLATENYTHCQSPFCYLGDTETAPGRQQVPALCPHPGGHFIKRPGFGRAFGRGASVELSPVSSIEFPKHSRLDRSRAGTTPQLDGRCCGGENCAGCLDPASSRGAQLCQGPFRVNSIAY